MNTNYNTIIIGAGVAGMSAAIYLKRANIDFLIVEKEMPGGQINRTSDIENYPGIHSITGPELAMQMYEQLKKLEIKLSTETVEKVIKEKDSIIVKTNKNEYNCKNIIIATGRRPKTLDLKNENKYINHGISFCAVCDGFFFKNQDVAVIGGGRSALEEALYLSNLCNKVTLIHRRSEFRAEDNLIDRLKSTKNVEIITDASIKDFVGDNEKLTGVKIKKNNKSKIIPVTGCFTYIGQIPNTEIFNNLEIKDENNYIEINQNSETAVPGIYAAGDCCKKQVYQIITAESEGIVAANMIITKENLKK